MIFYDFIVKSNRIYRQKDCLDLCLQRLIINECKCYYPKYSNLYKSKPCNNVTQLICIIEQILVFDINKINDCTLECPLECDSILATDNFFKNSKEDSNCGPLTPQASELPTLPC